MRLSADVISQAEQRTNPLNDRELVLRGLGIASIEHLGATRDLFDAMDFTDNRLTRLENFPRLTRLSTLFLAGNIVDAVDGKNLGRNVPNIRELVLTDNRISGLHEISNIAMGCRKLEFLTLVGNPVTRRQHYRLYTIHKIPTLKVLDFVKVKQGERDRAKRLAMSAAGAALEGDVKVEAREAAKLAPTSDTKTFIPGVGHSTKESFVVNFSPEQKAQIRDMIAGAKTPGDIERIEECVRRGEFPSNIVECGEGRKREANSDEGSVSKKARQEVN